MVMAEIPHACLSKTGITEECLYDVSSVASSLSGDMTVAASGGTEPTPLPPNAATQKFLMGNFYGNGQKKFYNIVLCGIFSI